MLSKHQPKPKPAPRDPDDPNGEIKLLAGERRMLTVLVQRYPVRLTRYQLGLLAGFTPRGGTFKNYFGSLRRHGLIVEDGGETEPTDAGMSFLDEVPPAPSTTEELQEMWKQRLLKGEREMLDVLIEEYPTELTREELGERVGRTFSGGTFKNYLGTLRRNGLAKVEGDSVRASETLFMEA